VNAKALNDTDLAALANYKHLLEQPSFVARATNLIGSPIEKGIEKLPQNWQENISEATRKALTKSLDVAMTTMEAGEKESYPRLHKLAAMVSGGVGGAFGLPALVIELPVSTTIMLRSIADIARANGEDLAQEAIRLECLNVFALGGVATGDDGAESGYFAVRAALAKAVSEAAAFIAERGILMEGAPALVRLIATIAARFQVQVTQKAAAQMVPVLGAAGGAAINLAFTDHFQDVATGHFGVRRLERQYGAEQVRLAYERIAL
jgi:hypothetical protein